MKKEEVESNLARWVVIIMSSNSGAIGIGHEAQKRSSYSFTPH